MDIANQKSGKKILGSFVFQKIKSKFIQQAVLNFLQINRVDHIYKSEKTEGKEFVEEALEKLAITYDVSDYDVKNIPQTGSFIVVANHPFGGIDGLILLSIILKKRPDFKLMANYLLEHIEELKPFLISVNPFDDNKNTSKNISGMKESMKLLKEGKPIGIFPAGEVSAIRLSDLNISDKIWNPVIGKLILKSQVKVIPVYFSGHNSLLFNLLGLINPKLRTLKLPSELFNKKDKITVRIGKPVEPKVFDEFSDKDELLRFLRAKTYALGSSLDVQKYFFRKKKKIKKQEQIIKPVAKHLMSNELSWLKKINGLLFTHLQFETYIAGAADIPNILQELSRIREITFRETGEGTNLSCDTDEFDLHYKHLFIWDTTEQKIVGAYRIGEGNKILVRFKKKGFYLNQLFKFKKEFNSIFKFSLELGRSFVVKEYQKNPYALMLLWKGINEFIKRNNDEYKYLIGPVSISNNFSKLSKDMLVQYITKKHFDGTLAKLVKPRKIYKYQQKGEGKKLREFDVKDFKILDKIISEIEPNNTKIPILLKKYLMQNAKIIAFNVDPKFNDSLDGLLVMKLDEIPTETFDIVK